MPAIVNLVKTTARTIGVGTAQPATPAEPAAILHNWWPAAPATTSIANSQNAPAKAYTKEQDVHFDIDQFLAELAAEPPTQNADATPNSWPPATPHTPADATGTSIWNQWRPGQQDACTAINRFLDNPNCQVMALTAPAGSGKTLLAAAAARSAQQRGLTAALLTPRRALQEQLMRDLQEVSKNLYGRARYECAYPEPLLEPLPERPPSDEITQCRTGHGMADTAACRGAASQSRQWNIQQQRWQLLQVATSPQQKAGAKELPVCPELNRCAYLKDLRALQSASFKIGNYALWQSWLNKNENPFEGVGLLILDEAHVLPSAMESFQKVTISGRDLQLLPQASTDTPYRRALAKAGPHKKARRNAIQQFAITSSPLWQRWADHHLPEVKERLESAKNNGDPVANRLDALAGKLAKLADMEQDGYICRVLLDQGGFNNASAGWGDIRPNHRGALWEIAPIAPQLAAFCGSDDIKVLLLSATLMPYFLDSIGTPAHQTIRHEVASSFPPHATPVHQLPEALSMAHRELYPTMPGDPAAEAEARTAIREERLTMWQTALLERAPRKTLFLSSAHRYVASDDWGIAHRLPHELVHWNSDSDGLTAACESFAAANESVLATASIQFGADFPHDAARSVVIPALPYAPAYDPMVMARKRRFGRRWYESEALAAVMQMSGRATRAENDWSEVAILDSRWDAFAERNREQMPQWFAERIDAGKRHHLSFSEFAALQDTRHPAPAPVHVTAQPTCLLTRRHQPVAPTPPTALQPPHASADTPAPKPTGRWRPTPRGKGLKLRRNKREAIVIPSDYHPGWAYTVHDRGKPQSNSAWLGRDQHGRFLTQEAAMLKCEAFLNAA